MDVSDVSDSQSDAVGGLSTLTEEAQMLISSDGDTCNIQKKDTAMGKVKMFFTRNGRFPNSIFFIIGNEFCERFSYYGMKTILVIYLTQSLGFHADPATALYHGFSMLCYFTPLVGAILADGYLGKFRTILYISIVYALGNIVMALTAIPPPQWIGMLVGLLLIGVGTGGIKPCVAAFGGDQFSPDQEKAVQSFFSVFYFTINAGSLLSTFLTPILRADVQCFGHDCYPLAFGVPACLMILSLVIFVCGRKLYKNYPPTGSLIGRVLRCIWCGIKKKLSSAEKADHWLDRTTDKFEPDFVDDVKRLLKVLLIFLPLPVFWALFDQQGSRWTLQAEQMDGEVVGGWRLKPDQMQAVNPILILLFIPVFEKFIYPLLDKCKVPNRPLQRMVAGMVLAAVAFVTAGFLQIRIDSSVEQPLGRNESGFTVINVLPCPVSVKSADLLYGDNLPRFTASEFQRYESGNYSVVMETDGSCPISSSMTANVELKPESAFRFVVYQMGGIIKMQQLLDLREKPKKGNASVSVISLVEGASSPRRVVLMNDDGELRVDLTADSLAQFHHLSAGSYGVYLQQDNENMKYTTQEVTLDNGAVYTVILIGAMDGQGQLRVHRFVGLLPNVVSMGYQVPQYIVLTMAEVMFSITGLSFAYSQAPTSMKSVLQAAWLLTIAVGNLIVLIVAEVKAIPSQAVEFFLFAVLMTVDIVVFAVMAWFYKYTTPTYHDQLEFADTTGLVTSSEPEDHSQRVKQQ